MDLEKLYKILCETTRQFRKGEALEGTPELVEAIKRGDEHLPGGVVEAYAMPPVIDVGPEMVQVDMVFITIGVDRIKAEAHRAELLAILSEYPEPDRLAAGPSYIEVGAAIGDQGAAFQLFALGKVLGLWDVITPATLGMPEAMWRDMAGQGFVMITGLSPQRAAA